jgi:transposase-like protein
MAAEDESTTADGRRRWQQWTEADARAAFAEHEKSGKSLTGFARERGVSLRRLMYWRKRLGGVGRPGFVAVTMPTTAETASLIEIALGDVVIRVREDIDIERLARIAVALGRHSRSGC